MDIDAIVETGRYRSDMGGFDKSAESIRTLGLLHPIVVTNKGDLLCGAKRLLACRQLGWTEVPTTVATTVDEALMVRVAERDENTCRKAMTISESLPLMAIQNLEAPKAASREKAGVKRPSPKSGEGSDRHGREMKRKAAKAVGRFEPTMDKVQEITDIAADPATPEPVRKVVKQAIADMDRTGRVEPNYKAVQDAKKAHAVDEFLADDLDLNRVKLRATAFKLMEKHMGGLMALDVDLLAEACDERCWGGLIRVAETSTKWFDRLLARRPQGLLVIP
jgi:ParB family chromosome partitioning protein